MKTLKFQAPDSNVEYVFRYTDMDDLGLQLMECYSTGGMICLDYYTIQNYLEKEWTHVVINHRTVFEICNNSAE